MKIIKTKYIYDYIESIAPFVNQSSNDNSGLLIGGLDTEISGICIALDATLDVIEEAHEKNANLIITHHPVIYNPLSSIKENTPVHRLIKYNMNLISAHTNFDTSNNCMSEIMLDLLELQNCKNIETINAINAKGEGYGKIAELDDYITAENLAKRVKIAFGCAVVRYVDGKKPLKRIAMNSGGGCGEYENAIKKGCDAFITGDIKWDIMVNANNIGLTLIDAGHYHTENIMCEFLCKKLQNLFTDIPIFVAENSIDFCKYIV